MFTTILIGSASSFMAPNVSNNRRQILQSEERAAQGLASWLIVLLGLFY
jgi:hypothetical protein